jgi:ribonucleoside-triphosphate reductase
VRRVTLVRRPDGETVPFDEARVVEAVERALGAAGGADPRLAAEIAGVVGLFLEKTFYDEVPSVRQVEDMVEKVLIETGHAQAAKAFILHRERRERLRDARAARDGFAEPTLFDPRALVVDDAAAGTSAPYSREAFARTLSADGLLPRATADEIAAVVEERLRRAGVSRAPMSLVRAVAESELLSRDAPIDLRRRAAASIAPDVLDAAMYRRASRGSATETSSTPALAAQELGAMALRGRSLSDLLPADVARAHLDGDLFVHGLGLPGALFAAAFSPDDVKRGAAPGAGTRGPEDAAATSRRLAAATGRGARVLSASTTNAAAVLGAPLAFASLFDDRRSEDVAEAAWQLLFETSAEPGARRLELDMTPDVPDSLADEPALGPTGEPLALPNGELSGTATTFATTLLKTHARGTGLPPRDLLPTPVVGVSERILAGPASRAALRQAAEIALTGERVVFPMLRDRGPSTGTSISRGRGVARAPDASRCCAGRVTLNLPRAARRSGRGNIDGFLRECDRLVDLAVAAHRSRRELLALASVATGGPLAPLFQAARGRAPLYDLAAASWSIAVTGLNEALVHLTGFELHEGDETVARAAKRIASYLAVRVKSAGMAAELATTFDADEDAAVARRFLVADRRQAPEELSRSFPQLSAYAPGVSARGDAPVDLLLRAEREECLHACFSSATLVLPTSGRDAGGADGLVALLGKCLTAGAAVQVEFRVWS